MGNKDADVTDEKLQSLLLAIQHGVIDDRPWGAFVPLLRDALGANYANLIFRRIEGRSGDELEISSGDVPDWVVPRYRREYSTQDPIPYFRMEPGRAYLYEELAGIRDLADDPFRRDFLLPAGFAHFMIFRVTEPAGCNIWVTITRKAEAGPFGEPERNLCQRLALHLSPALACRSALIRASAEKAEYQYAAEMLSFGVIALDGRERVIRVDRTVERTLDESPDIFIAHGRLRARAEDARLQQALGAALQTQRTQYCHVGGQRGFDLLIVPIERPPSADADATRLLVYMSGGQQDIRDSSGHIAAAFDLSPTQAKLTMLLVNGLSLTDAARQIGITEQTARTYSKQIYFKTGTCRQGELVQRILKSVIALA